MMINTSTFSKGLKIVLVYYLMTILIVKCGDDDVGVDSEGFIKISGSTLKDLMDQEKKIMESEQKPLQNPITTLSAKNMGSIQVGIENGIQKTPLDTKLSPADDFESIKKKKFENILDPIDGKPYPTFTFYIYAKYTFHYLRDLFDITPEDYIESFCTKPLKLLSNPGSSQSVLYLTSDKKFFLKSVQSSEYECIQKLLPEYKTHMFNNQESLLTKYSGFYRLQSNSTNVKLISMTNILPSNVKLHQKFDLKGSTLGREANVDEVKKGLPTYKDLDFNNTFHPYGLFLKSEHRLDLLNKLNIDVTLLKKFFIMDYSMLMGVHNIDDPSNTQDEKTTNLKLVAIKVWDNLMANSIEIMRVNHHTDVGPLVSEYEISLRKAIPAKNKDGNRLLLFIGIIDILQTYRFAKQIELGAKTAKLMVTSLVCENQSPDSISVQNQNKYSERFINYMTDSVFRPLDEISKRPIKRLRSQTSLTSMSNCLPKRSKSTIEDDESKDAD